MAGTNPVATWLDANNTTQTGTTYKTAIDGDFQVAKRGSDRFAPHAQGTPNMTVALDPGHIFLGGSALVELAAQNSSTLTAPVSNPRNDIVVVDAYTGTISVVTGTEAASPADPAIPTGKYPVARLSMTVAMTSIADSIITDIRNFDTLGSFGIETSLAGGTTTNIGSVASRSVLVTGTSATITGWGSAGSLSAPFVHVRFASTGLVITGSLLPGGATAFPSGYTVQAGDAFLLQYQGGSTWQIVGSQLANGQALVAASSGPAILASGGPFIALTSLTVGLPAGYKHFTLYLDGIASEASPTAVTLTAQFSTGSTITSGYQWTRADYNSNSTSATVSKSNSDTSFQLINNIQVASPPQLSGLKMEIDASALIGGASTHPGATCEWRARWFDNTSAFMWQGSGAAGVSGPTISTTIGSIIITGSVNWELISYRLVGIP